jgi:hypothetical protein
MRVPLSMRAAETYFAFVACVGQLAKLVKG